MPKLPLLACLAAVAAVAADDWPMGFHDSLHSGRTAEIVAPPLTLAWTWKNTSSYDNDTKFNSIRQSYPTLPIYYQGRLYLQGGMNANRLFALDPATGKTLWEVDNPGYTSNGTRLFQFANYPAAVKGRILYASTDYTATMDAATGGDYHNVYNTNGAFPFGGTAIWNSLAVFQFVETDNGFEDLRPVYDPVKLAIGGHYVAPDHSVTVTDFTFRVPAVDGKVVYANRLGQLVAYDFSSGADLWTWGNRNTCASPAVWNHTLFFYASTRGALSAIPLGALSSSALSLAAIPVLWSVPIAGACSPIASDGVVYTGSSDSHFYALDARTGAIKWKFAAGKPFSQYSIPAISGSLIFIPGGDGILYAVNKDTGEEVWRYTGIAAFGPVVIAGGLLYVSDAAFNVYGFQPAAAANGPAVTALSPSRVNSGGTLTLSGAGFTGATAAQLDDPSGTALSGLSVAADTSATVTIPDSVGPGRYHISIATPAGRSVDGPELEVAPAGSLYTSVLGISQGPNDHGTDHPFQRHLLRLPDGTLMAAYSGRLATAGAADLYFDYQLSRDGGRTWSPPAPFNTGGQGSSVLFAASFGVSLGADNRIQLVYQQWPSYKQTFAAYNYDESDLLTVAASPVSISNPPAFAGPLVAEPGGKLWVAYALPRGQGSSASDLYSSWSADGGATWTQTPKISQASGTTPSMTLYNGLPFVVYTDGAALASSAWNGVQWSTPQPLPGALSGAADNLSMVTAADGTVHLASGSAAGIQYLNFGAGGWSSATLLEAGATGPSLTTNGADLWCFYATSSKNIAYRRWHADTNTWDAAVAVTNDAMTNTRPAALALSPDSGIPVIWTVGTAPPFEVHSAVVPAQSAASGLEARVYSAPLLVTAKPAALSASAVGGQPPYTFAWDAPAAGASLAGTSSAAPSATFTKAGTYRFSVTVTDAAGASAAAFADVGVAQAPTAIVITAPPGSMQPNVAYALQAVVTDQFGNPLVLAPALTWSLASATPRGAIDVNGRFLPQQTGDFKIAAAIPGGIGGSLAVTVTPASTVPPVISGVTQSATAVGSETIQWTTSDAADSQVEYGFTGDYGTLSPLNATLVTGHSVSLTGLAPGKLYHYRVRSKGSGGQAVSPDFTFTSLGRRGGR